MTGPVRVVIADDHPMFRYGMTAALAAAPLVEVVGDAENGDELIALVDRTEPDVVLTYSRTPNATTLSRRSSPSPPVSPCAAAASPAASSTSSPSPTSSTPLRPSPS